MSASRIPPNMNQLQNTLKPKTYLPPPPLIPNKRRYREDQVCCPRPCVCCYSVSNSLQTILSGGEEPLAGPSKIQRTDSVVSTLYMRITTSHVSLMYLGISNLGVLGLPVGLGHIRIVDSDESKVRFDLDLIDQ